MPVQPSYLPPLVAHLVALGLEDGDSLPSYREAAEALGIHRDSTKRLYRALREADIIREGEGPGSPPVLASAEILREINTPEGMARFRGESRTKTAAIKAAAPDVWAEALGRFDALGGDLTDTLHIAAQVITSVPALIEGLVPRIALEVVRLLSERGALAPVPVRQPTQTRTVADPNNPVAVAVAALGGQGAADALDISLASARRYAGGKRRIPADVIDRAKALVGNLKTQ